MVSTSTCSAGSSSMKRDGSAVLREGNGAVLSRPGDADIGEAALFLEAGALPLSSSAR
jgi:hypothetical protein